MRRLRLTRRARAFAIDRRQERWRNVYRRGHEYSMNIFNQTRKSGVSTRRGDECYAVDNTPP